jgi:hypothetical protein
MGRFLQANGILESPSPDVPNYCLANDCSPIVFVIGISNSALECHLYNVKQVSWNITVASCFNCCTPCSVAFPHRYL